MATSGKKAPHTEHGRIQATVSAQLRDGRLVPVGHAKLLLLRAGADRSEPTLGELDDLVRDNHPVRHTHTGPDGRASFDQLPLLDAEVAWYWVVLDNVTPFEADTKYFCKLAAVSRADRIGSADIVFVPEVKLDVMFFTNGVKRSRDHGLVGDTLWVTTHYMRHGAVNTPEPHRPIPGMRATPEPPLSAVDTSTGYESRAVLGAVGRVDAAASFFMAPRGLDGGTPNPNDGAYFRVAEPVMVDSSTPVPVNGDITTHAARTETEFRPAIAHWTLIRNSAEALAFNNYKQFLDHLFCEEGGNKTPEGRAFRSLEKRRFLPFNDTDSYRVLKAATEAYVMVNCGVLSEPWDFRPVDDADYLDRRDLPEDKVLAEELLNRYLTEVDPDIKTLPYLALIRSKLPDVRIHIDHDHAHDVELCAGFIRDRLQNPCMMELIWSYWQEEGMLVQSMNAITRRFQNVRSNTNGNGLDPLANMEIDMLRPLNNLLWGYVQDEQHRLTVVRRNYEYDHHYGIRLDGKAVRNFHPADSRSKFIEAFHNLLRQLMPFYRQDDDTTVKADAFPILNALKEVHLILSQGAHNQYGDLPSTSRIEMLMQQWMLARPEFREFLPTRLMVAHPEPWMDRVDAMKKVQGWSDTSVAHFRDLAMFGEMLLLSIRTTHWTDMYEPNDAFAWARFWRPQAQGYMHAYRAVTGVDMTAEVPNPKLEAMMPSELLRQRLEGKQRVA
ncbi:8-amino-7-oxononanoate synthase [Massilia sp. SR12]